MDKAIIPCINWINQGAAAKKLHYSKAYEEQLKELNENDGKLENESSHSEGFLTRPPSIYK